MILMGYTSASNGMQALIQKNDSTANNIANVNTVGYKRERLTFMNIYDSAVTEKAQDGSGDVKTLGDLSVGSQVQKLTYDFSQGALSKTGSPFDMAIEGDGFFKVQSQNGTISYTRNGSFALDSNKNLVTKDGDYVLDNQGARITIDTNSMKMHSYNDITVNENGQIQINNEQNPLQLQTIGVYDFANKDDLMNVGGSKFRPTTPQTNPEVKPNKFVVVQGNLEMSNANIVNEMINTINTSRNYESLSKVVKEGSDTLSSAIKVGRISG